MGAGTRARPVLGVLDGVCRTRPAEPADAVGGVVPGAVACPSSTDEVAAVMRAAARHDLAVVARGSGTKQDWAARPTRCDVLVETGGLRGVVDHAAGDLVVVVRAGTALCDLQETLAGAAQQLAVDAPAGAERLAGTVGGAVATGVSGPRRLAYGTLRDLLIGVTVVRADGRVAHAGGRVVKNVAGYDLGKLVTGSFGTLGLVVEAAFRLHPLPAATAWVTRRVEDTAEAARLAAAVRASQLVPAAVEVDCPAQGPLEVAVLLEGTEAGVAERAGQAARLLGLDVAAPAAHDHRGGGGGEGMPGWWGLLPFAPGAVGVKLTTALSGVAGVLAAARRVAATEGVPVRVRGSAGTGVLHAGLPGDDPAAVARVVAGLRCACESGGGHAVVLSAGEPVRQVLDAWGPVPGLELMRRVKDQFDPERRLAPGRFVGGI